jgi:catechol 2,3-dioxygenase-like lactoylglutathione lyase family enzyme
MLNESNVIGFLATTNPTKARKFYETTLGLKFISSDQFALVFDMNGTMLRVQIVDQVNPGRYTALGWEVSDIEREVDALSKRGVTFARYDGMNQDDRGIWTAPSRAKIAWFTDPDGNILSLTQFPVP